jgi:hypothetical protein
VIVTTVVLAATERGTTVVTITAHGHPARALAGALRSFGRAGTAAATLRLTALGRTKLARHQWSPVRITVSFTPHGGKSVSSTGSTRRP